MSSSAGIFAYLPLSSPGPVGSPWAAAEAGGHPSREGPGWNSTGSPGHYLQHSIIGAIDLIHKSHNASVPYPTMLHWEQKWAHFCSISHNACFKSYSSWHIKGMTENPECKTFSHSYIFVYKKPTWIFKCHFSGSVAVLPGCLSDFNAIGVC